MGGPHLEAVWEIARKELRTSFRDRQTTLYALVLPLCMYPVLFWLMIQGFLVVQGKKEHTQVTVGVVAQALEHVTPELEQTLTRKPEDEDSGPDDGAPMDRINVVDLERFGRAADLAAARAWMTEDADSADQGDPSAERPDAVLYLPTPSGSDESDPINRAQLFYDSTRGRSDTARKRIESRLPEIIDARRAERARSRGFDPAQLTPLSVEKHDIAPVEDKGALILSLMLPMLLVMMTVMGAFFPAVDLTAGEKERKTAETTLLLPIPRTAIHEGKIVAVAATAVLATVLNLIALGLSAEHLLASLMRGTDVRIQLPVLALLSIVPLAVLYTFFVSAVLTGIAGLAASFKEGQALLGPAQMLFIFPAMAVALPGLELNVATAWIPVVNVALAFRAMLLGQALYLEYLLTAVALVIYAWLAIRIAVRLLAHETVLLSGKTIPIKRLFSLLRP
ncbi:MAG: sodium transport system permease protein [Chlamydiales bacterium]|jgi:sodium transport system permease protein